MYTINISLPKQLYQRVDSLIKEEGFASRSEFFRTLIRVYTALKGEKLELLEFSAKSIDEVEKGLLNTGKYNQKFIQSLVSGLGKSSVYENKTIKR